MAFSTPFSELTRLVEGLERSGVDLHRVTADGGEPVDGVLSATIEFGASLCDLAAAEWATVEVRDGGVDLDGRLSVDLSFDAPLLPADLAAWASEPAVSVEEEALVVSLPVEIPAGTGTRSEDGRPAASTGSPGETDLPTEEGGETSGSAGGSSDDAGESSDDAGESSDDAGESSDDTGGRADTTVTTEQDETGSAPAERDEADANPPAATASRSRDVPPFRDHDLLREVYETCDTFAEMTEAIGMDVTAETVRRYMIDAGIHEPTSYATGSDAGADGRDEAELDDSSGEGPAEAEHPSPGPVGRSDGAASAAESAQGPPEEAILADGIGLPEGVTVDGLIEAITVSNTLYEVSHALDLDRGQARNVLGDLNLLDLVVGRLAMEAEREVTRDEVVERLRTAADGA